jgi:hypothetical protein
MWPSKKTLDAAYRGREDERKLFNSSVAKRTWVNKFDEPQAPRVENLNTVLHMGKVFSKHLPVKNTVSMPLRPMLTSKVEFHWKEPVDFSANREVTSEIKEKASKTSEGKPPKLGLSVRTRYAETFPDLSAMTTMSAKRDLCQPSMHSIGTIVFPGDDAEQLSHEHLNQTMARASHRPGARYAGQQWRPSTNTQRRSQNAPGAFRTSHMDSFSSPFGRTSCQGLSKSASAPSDVFYRTF